MGKLVLPPDKFRTPGWEKDFVENYWLGLGDVSGLNFENPLVPRTEEEKENPVLFLLDQLRRPENFFFTCKNVLNVTLAPYQLAILRELWYRPFPMLIATRGGSKSFMMALYLMLRGILCPGTKSVVVGAAFRQSKIIFDYCQTIWENAPVLRDMVGNDKRNGPRRDVDRCALRMGNSTVTAIPIGDGSKVRGLRAGIIAADEFNSMVAEVFEQVIRGFAAVSNDPLAKLRFEAERAAMRELGFVEEKEGTSNVLRSNQTIISGTVGYTFEHFYEYFTRYRQIVQSKGDPKKLEEIFGQQAGDHDWRDYSVIRIPEEKIPPGFMDRKQVAHARATMNRSLFRMEYKTIWVDDSDGFFKRSLIESCVAGKPFNPIEKESCGLVKFWAVLKGDPNKRYVFAIDPASERDNLAISVLELWPDHRRVVHVWTTTRARHKAKVKAGMTQEHDYYRYAARKVRDLMRDFPPVRIGMDPQGGGVAIMEALADPNTLRAGERPLLPTVDPDKPKPTDDLPGEHIIELANFAQGDWVSAANHGMKKDFEERELLFPIFDPAVIALALEDDKASGRVKADDKGDFEKVYETLEDVFMEIEDLKNELCQIVHSKTAHSQRERFDLPDVRKGKDKKDRYSALLIANMIARGLQRLPPPAEYRPMGGFTRALVENAGGKVREGPLYVGPAWVTEQMPRNYGVAVSRGGRV